MIIKCETCWQFDKECLEIIDEDKDFCLENKLFLWNPRDEAYCLDCPMHYMTSKGTIGCARHSEPCFKNWNFSKEEEWEDFKVEYKERIEKLCKNCGSCQRKINQEEQEKEAKKI